MDAESQVKLPHEKTATEVLVDCMEDFGTYEPHRIMLIYTDNEGGVTIKGNARVCEAVGMFEVAKALILKNGGE